MTESEPTFPELSSAHTVHVSVSLQQVPESPVIPSHPGSLMFVIPPFSEYQQKLKSKSYGV